MSSDFFSLRFLAGGIAIICYFYHFSYISIPLYQFYTFSTEFMFKSKPARIINSCLNAVV